ncbi:hypothetical protein FVQ98_14510 [Ottowia sp. GY511]|uniref:Phage tail length tape measure family protein n=1 Tax=Ottowia flava TaxID=2675430 RepID=A0ABW4KPR8_9BURK|nr:phage tail length tape measure family protein [Ottowia sp. GY511]TXK26367.1 hypothetical protein FVQ98_14510 [Ottowia sp. GY511]
MADLQSTIAVTADASGVEPGLAPGKKSIMDFATAAEQGGARAAAGLGKLGDSADQAGKRVGAGLDKGAEGVKRTSAGIDQATRSMSRSMERYIAVLEAGGQRNAAYWEALAKQRGIDTSQIDGLLGKMRELEGAQASGVKSMDNMGMSAKATAAAMRGVPAQIQDIIVSLQGGQAPMTVFLQQGSQLSGMFGGMGAAAKAVGTYLLGLVNPFTVVATAAAVVAAAWYQGTKEAEGYQKALVMTGNAAGQTVGNLQAVADAIGATGRSRGAAVDALTEIAAQGIAAGDGLQRFAQVAIDMERATGQAISKTVDQFADLGREPVKASEKLNEQFHYLTAATYEHIRSLEAQGKSTEAARVAQESFANSMASRTGQVIANAGLMERAWNGVTGAAKRAWEVMLNIGKAQTNADKLGGITSELARLQNEQAAGGFASNGGGAAFGRPNPQADSRRAQRIQQLQAEAAALGGVIAGEKANAEAIANRQRVEEAGIAWAKGGDKHLSDKAKMERELAQARELGTKAGKSQAEIEQRLNNIRASYDKKGGGGSKSGVAPGENEVARIRAMIQEEERYTQALQERGAQAAKLTAGEKLVMQIQQQLNTGIKGVARSNKEAALAEAERLVVVEKGRIAEEKRAKAIEDARIANEKLVADTFKTAEGLERQASELDASNAMWGKGKVAVEEYRLAQAQEMLAMAEGSDRFMPEYVDALRRVVEARQHLTEATRDSEYKRLNEGIQDWTRSAREQLALYQDESKYAGLTALERAKITAERQVELKLAREIDKINKSNLNDAQKQALISDATAAAAIEKSAATAKVVNDDWQKTADSINQSLTDALMRGFEDGKGFGKSFVDTLKNMFKTLVLRPIISFIVQPIGNAISGIVSGFLGGGGQGGGMLGDLFGGASNGSSLMNLFTGTGGNWGAISGALGGGMSWANALGSIYANTTGTGISGLLATNGAYGTAAGGMGGAGGLAGIAGGIAMVAIPLIIGAIIENNSRDRTGGAAFATSNWRKDPGTAPGSGTAYDTATNQLPAYQDMVNRMVELGHSQNMSWYEQFKGNERALYAVLQQAEEMARGMSHEFQALPDGKDITEMYGDFYRGQGYADPASMGWWNWKDVDFASVDTRVVEAARQLSVSLVDTLTQTARTLGESGDFRVTTGWANRGKGDIWGAAQIMRDGQQIAGFDRSDYKDTQHYMQAVFGATMDAFRSFDLPQWATNLVDSTQDKINALTGDKVGEEAAALYQQASTELTQTLAAIKMMIDVMPDFKGATQDAVYNIAQALGGLDNLNQLYGGYLQNFYSAEEQANLQRAQVQSQFEQAGLKMPATRAEFRAMVEALDLTTEAGQQAFATLMQLSGGFAQITADGGALLTAAFEGTDQLAGIIRDGLLGNLASQQVGEQMADVVVGGIYNAIAGGFANQITQIMMDGVVTPMLQAAVAGTSVTEAVSQATIDKMVADATAVAQALGQILNNEGFQHAMRAIEGAMLSIAPQITAPQPYYTSYDTRRQQAQAAADAAARAAEQRAQEAQRAADEEARRQQAILTERLGLTKQLLQLEGNTNALRQLELEALDPSNRALQERIWALQDEAEAETRRNEAMKEAQEFLGSFTKSIEEFIFNTRMAQASGFDSYQLAAGKFSAQMALARGGDRDALNGITGYADTLIGSIRAESTSSDEANLRIGRVLGQLGELPKQVSAEQLIVNAVDSMKNTLSGVLIDKFEQLDGNVDGLLTFSELQASGMASDAQIRALIARVDVNGDGMISKTEAVRAQAELTKLGINTVNTSVGGVTTAVGTNTSSTGNWLSNVNSSVSGVNSAVGNVTTGVGGTNSRLDTNNQLSDFIRANTLNLNGIHDASQGIRTNTGTLTGQNVQFNSGGMQMTVRAGSGWGGGGTGFAVGGAFTNGIVNEPTTFRMGLMGEAGPEAIMPLVRLSGGQLGVRALGGGIQDLVAAVAALQVAVEQLRGDQAAQARAMVDLERLSANALSKLLRLAESHDRDGAPAPREAVRVEVESVKPVLQVEVAS